MWQSEGKHLGIYPCLSHFIMAISYTFQRVKDLLRVKACGADDSLEDTLSYGRAIIQEAIKHNCQRVLCDERELVYRLGVVDTYKLGVTLAEVAPSIARVAIVCAPQDPQAGFFETVVRNRGLELRMFEQMEEAKAWLTEP
ncbi:MAG: hypothetical protein D6722_20775 [Bacteroidetes bacterium]|nr:MAG: hypothetical protein D6722_20775 [Bacteroidota bacterium]